MSNIGRVIDHQVRIVRRSVLATTDTPTVAEIFLTTDAPGPANRIMISFVDGTREPMPEVFRSSPSSRAGLNVELPIDRFGHILGLLKSGDSAFVRWGHPADEEALNEFVIETATGERGKLIEPVALRPLMTHSFVDPQLAEDILPPGTPDPAQVELLRHVRWIRRRIQYLTPLGTQAETLPTQRPDVFTGFIALQRQDGTIYRPVTYTTEPPIPTGWPPLEVTFRATDGSSDRTATAETIWASWARGQDALLYFIWMLPSSEIDQDTIIPVLFNDHQRPGAAIRYNPAGWFPYRATAGPNYEVPTQNTSLEGTWPMAYYGDGSGNVVYERYLVPLERSPDFAGFEDPLVAANVEPGDLSVIRQDFLGQRPTG